MESIWIGNMSEPVTLDSLDSPEEDFGTTTFLWNAFRKGRYVDVEFGIRNSTTCEPVSFSAHKLVLAMWSPYFADKFYVPDHAVENIIIYEDVNPEAFQTMLGYMYGYHHFPKSVKKAFELYEVAVKFEVASLAERTVALINQTKPDSSNVFDLLEASEYMKNENLKERCLRLISDKTSEILKSYDITEISLPRLRLILNSTKLSLTSEYELLKFVYAWGKNRYITVPQYSSTREAVEEFLPQINFLALRNQQFAEFHKIHPDFLEEKEVISIFMNIAEAGSWPMPEWHNDQIRVYSGSNLQYRERYCKVMQLAKGTTTFCKKM